MQVYIEGRLRTRSWTDQTGNKRYTTEVLADTLQMLGKRQDNPNNPNAGGYQQPAQQPYQQPAQAAVPPVQANGPEDDLPF